eukprot:TRINITY_DN3735_c0_g1_i1.p2 TRINITY_DN3735_c0_g1~~TRINITY_DN3735_c0_g1_i1.p2  ORF type:complete len:116 (+),score=26.57 TRINITY_DN3735_c0_g1_i1:74-421(+)
MATRFVSFVPFSDEDELYMSHPSSLPTPKLSHDQRVVWTETNSEPRSRGTKRSLHGADAESSSSKIVHVEDDPSTRAKATVISTGWRRVRPNQTLIVRAVDGLPKLFSETQRLRK